MNSINVVLTVIMFALFAIAGLLVKFPDKGDDLMVQLAKGQLFSEEGVYAGNVELIEGTLEQRVPDGVEVLYQLGFLHRAVAEHNPL